MLYLPLLTCVSVVYIKRTWAKHPKFVEYFSDAEDPYVPTIDLGVPNTERGDL